MKEVATDTGRVVLPERFHGLLCHREGAPEVGLDDGARHGVLDALYLAEDTEASVIDDNVDPTERISGLGERVGDLLSIGDVHGQDEDAAATVFCNEVVEHCGLTQRCNNDFVPLENELCEGATKASRCTSDYMGVSQMQRSY